MSVEYRSCCSPIVINVTKSMTIPEKLCYIVELLTDVIDVVNNFEVSIDGLEKSEDITNKRLLSEYGDFTGAWFGESKSLMNERIQYGNFLGKWEGEKKSSLNARIKFGDFEGTWFNTTLDSLITKIESGNFEGTWFNQTHAELLDMITNGNFLGTWNGQTNSELNQKVDASLTLYQDVIDKINGISGFILNIIDGGYIANPTTPTYRDLGSVSEAVTETINCGLVIYPCECV